MYVQWFQRRSFGTVGPGRKLSCKAKKRGARKGMPQHVETRPTRDTRVVRPAFTPSTFNLQVSFVKPLSAVYYVTSTAYAYHYWRRSVIND